METASGDGDTKSSVGCWAVSGRLRIVPRESLGAALHTHGFQGPQHRPARPRHSARLKLNEYGLYRVDDNTRVAGEDEDGMLRRAGAFAGAPELRENRGEIEAAEAGALHG